MTFFRLQYALSGKNRRKDQGFYGEGILISWVGLQLGADLVIFLTDGSLGSPQSLLHCHCPALMENPKTWGNIYIYIYIYTSEDQDLSTKDEDDCYNGNLVDFEILG